MSYSIQYGTSRYDSKIVDKKKRWLVMSICLLCVAVLICAVFSEQISDLRRHILPFFEPQVQAAFEQMAVQIGDGVEFQDAATAFCREILFEAAG